ncbi:UNVERIFIED_CONTAM: hypothetical protein HDU68_000043 [Siphonaria sp. JEL0065]|nr:hypothetical protein HDU68_000043 [Siphonaria sp. JEL0065]
MLAITNTTPIDCVCCATPKTVVAPFDGAVRSILLSLQQEFGTSLQGVLITGSVITGNFHVNSDIDLFVIISDAKRQRRLFQLAPKDFVPALDINPASPTNPTYGPRMESVQCEVFVNPAKRMVDEIKALEDPTVNAWRLGHVLFEATPVAPRAVVTIEANPVSYLRQYAIEAYNAGKPNFTTWTQFKIDSTRYNLMDGLLDAWDAIEAGDAASGSIMLSRGLSSALDVLYESRGWWGVKAKKRLLDLKENTLLVDTNGSTKNDAKRALQLSRRIARDDLELVERYKALKQLVNVVVEPFGGMMVEWVTEWESVEL